MKVYQIYNEQRSRFGGEPVVIDATMRILTQNGHDARLVMKSSRVLENSILKRMNAFWSGIYNIRAFREMDRLIEKDRPDVSMFTAFIRCFRHRFWSRANEKMFLS